MLKNRADRPSQIADRVGEYLLEGDLEGIVSLFHPQCRICFPLEGPPLEGHDGVRELFAPFCEIKPRLFSEVSGEMINGDTALIQGKWRFEDQNGTILSEGESTEVAKKLTDGSWGYYIDCPFGAPPLLDD